MTHLKPVKDHLFSPTVCIHKAAHHKIADMQRMAGLASLREASFPRVIEKQMCTKSICWWISQ